MSYGVRRRLFQGQTNTQLALVAVAVVLLFAAPLLLDGYQTRLLTQTLIFAVFATAFNLLYGYSGLLSFGHAMFIAAAGYTVAKVVQVLGPALGFPELFGGASVLATWVLAVVLGIAVATLLAVFVGFLSVRLEEIYFAMITLSFSMAIFVLVNQDTIGSVLETLGVGDGVFTNGSDGLTFTMGQVDLFGFGFQLVNIIDPAAYYVITALVFLVAMYALWRVVNSPFGMICTAIRENPGRASALGVDVTRHRWVTFILSGAFSGLAGALLIPLQTGVLPSDAHWTASARPVIMTVIGGPYSFLGPLVGAFTYEYLRESINQLEYWQFSFGVLILVVVLFFDNGVAGGIERFIAWSRVAIQRYHDDGASGVAAFTRETVRGWVRTARRTVTQWGRSLRGRVGRLRQRLRLGA